jgi:hypothetical protein
VNFGQFPRPPSNLWTESEEVIESIRQDLYQMRQKGYIQEVPNMREYISPYNGPWSERIDDEGRAEDLIDEIVGHYTQQEEEEEEEFVVEPLPRVTHYEALQALHTLRRYEEEYDHSSSDFLRQLRAYERELEERNRKTRVQGRLDSWFTKGDSISGTK